MFGFGQESEIRRPNTQELIRDRQICKGNVLSRRKSVEQVAKEELERLVLPDIHKTRSRDTCYPRYEQTRTKSFIRKGYTFDLNKLKADKLTSVSLDEDNIEQLLSLKSLDSFEGKNENHYFGKFWNPRKFSEQNEGKRESSSRGDNDSGFSDSSANQEDHNEKQHKDRQFIDKHIEYGRENPRGYITPQRWSSFPDVPSQVDLPRRLVVRKAVQADTGASMCTQSMNSLSTELAMFKDAFSKGHKEARVDGTKTPYWLLKCVVEKDKSHEVVGDRRSRESNSRSSPRRSDSESSISAAAAAVDSRFAVFKRKRKNLLSRSQKSRESRISSESPFPSPEVKDLRISPAPSQHSATERSTDETSCCEKSVASETVDACCTCVTPVRVQVTLKDNIRTSKNLHSKKKEVKIPTKYYECFTPVTSKVAEFSPTKETDRAPFKIDSKVATMQRALAEFKERKPPKVLQNRQLTRKDQSVFSDTEISTRKNTSVKATSHEWPPQMKLSDDEDEAEERPSLSGNDETSWSVNSKCDEWLNRWIQENHGDDS